MHPRKAIRQSIAARLAGDATLQGLDVRLAASRARVTQETHLPRCLVFFGDDELVRHDSEAPREEVRTAPLRIVFQVDANSGEAGQDLLDDLAERAEQLVMEDESHGGAAHKSDYVRTDASYDDEGERILVGCILAWDVEYKRQYTPRVLPDATGLDVEIDVPSETPDQIEAQATVELETE